MENKIEINKRKLFIEYSQFSNIISGDVAVYENDHKSVLKFLSNRGFDIKTPLNYKKEYKTLAKFHKIGIKNDVFVLINKGSKGFKLQFGNIKNLWDSESSAWDWESDDRYYHPTYLEAIRVKLEILKVSEFIKNKTKFDFVNTNKSDLSPEDYIIDNLKINTHLHGVVNCLDDIKKSITTDSYNFIHNSNDRDGNKIICGELKYFYDYNKRLSCGIVWHHINNMWWIISGKNLFNIASFEIFDFNNDPVKKPVTKSKIESMIKQQSDIYNFKKAEAIYKSHINLF